MVPSRMLCYFAFVFAFGFACGIGFTFAFRMGFYLSFMRHDSTYSIIMEYKFVCVADRII
jgi:hypothetical protein